jgi:hypothetical protein
MLLAAGFFDESSDEDFEERVFTVGGYVASGAASVQLELRWKDLLDKYALAYFKASELESLIGQFAKFRDNPTSAAKDRFTKREKEPARSIKTEFIDLLCKQSDLIALSATINMQHLKAFRHDKPDEFRKIPSFFQLCGQIVIMEAGLMMLETNAQNPPSLQALLRPVFDSHREFGPRFERGFDVFRQKNPNASRYLLPPIFEDEKTYIALQAADLFAYEIRRTVGNHFFDPERDIRIAAGRLFPQVSKTYVLDYPTLETLAAWQGRNEAIPVSPLEEIWSGPIQEVRSQAKGTIVAGPSY